MYDAIKTQLLTLFPALRDLLLYRVVPGESGIITSSCLLKHNAYPRAASRAGIVLLATGLMGWCAFYPLLGLNTCPNK